MAKFKARARTLEMLGRQQIAGIPTAISELFKNAHDAYADKVEVDYYRSDGLFVLRDDGLGMTKEDFEERWLTLGTESKLDTGKGLIPPPNDPNKPERPILGEKGIGRLAIASIGPQVLVLTKAKRQDGLHDLVAAFINWGLFELPGIDLDQVVVPLRTFKIGEIPDKTTIREMVEEVISNVKTFREQGKVSSEDAEKLIKQLNDFGLNPHEIDGYLGQPSLTGNGHGTHFFILPTDDFLQSAIEENKNSDKASQLTKMLIGFTNTMTPEAPESRIKASFRYHKTDDFSEELIGNKEFFTPEEFRNADHHFKGVFDEYGQFKGTVNVYGEEMGEHVVPWDGAKGRKTSCGPFTINVAYIQGTAAATKLPLEDYTLIMKKLDKIGGLYIYKDNIRILPYGDSDYDFLEIEQNRTKSASFYFFSYRRIFGVIEISRQNNRELIEKAGREGFIENKAYRQFKEISKNFFVQLAADFFRDKKSGGGPKSEFWLNYKSERERLYKAKKEREENATAKKNIFIQDLERFFNQIEHGDPQKELQLLLDSLKRDFASASQIKDSDQATQEFLNLESAARKRLDNLRDKYKVIRSKGFAMGKNLKFDWDAYSQEAENLENTLFIPATERIEEIIHQAEKEFHFEIDRRRRLERAFNDIIEDTKKATNNETRETKEILDEVSDKVITLTREIMVETENDVKQMMSEFAKMNISEMDDSKLVSERTKLESKIISDAEKNKKILESIQVQLESITWTKDNKGDIITSTDITESMEDELLTLKERADSDLELSQLGLAVGVIHHEFSGTVKSIRDNIKRLKAWADVNQDLNPLYQNIRANFEHLDGYLTLFTPLNRRLYRKEIEMTGTEIKKFLEDIFAERMRRHDISFETTSNFNKKKLFGYPSTFYPVFVNVIDNAIFWLKDRPIPRKIVLEADDTGYFISNNGPEISIRDREIIFEFGFTRKPNGRGLGLYISREVLSKVGYRIYVDEPQQGQEVTFRIEQNQIKEEK
ncbi:MAG: ATP-binding protein [Candidatus Methanoperedens sp.]|nr:ATP-binding protein [Candidatus Methanoperedens sp.]